MFEGEKEQVLKDYELLREKLGGEGASKNAAEVILKLQ
jgi:lipid-A-disaccharide synthase